MRLSRTLKLAAILGCLVVLGALPAAAQQWNTVNGYTLSFNGVTYDSQANTSTWSYTLVWDESVYKHELSHLTIGFCAGSEVLSASPAGYSSGYDGSTGLTGIKWDVQPGGIDPLPNQTPRDFTFTLAGMYAVGQVSFAAKSKDDNISTIDGPACEIAAPSIAVGKTCVPDVFVGDQITYSLTVANNGNVALQNVSVVDALIGVNVVIPTLGVGGQWAATGSITPTAEGTIENTVSASGSYWNLTASASASCSTNVHKLSVFKTAQTSYRRNWDWNWSVAQRQGGTGAYEVCSGQTRNIGFTGSASRAALDSNFAASGTITVVNDSPIPANIAAITDDLDGQSVPVTCSTPFPFSLPAGSSITCTYTAPLSNGNDRVNVATATISNGTGFSGTAAVTFGDPSEVLDESATATFNVICPAGFTCSNVDPVTFNSGGSVDFDVTVANTSAMCDTTYQLLLVSTLTESDTARAQSQTADLAIYTCGCSTGCTLTIGYWKTHAGFTGNNADRLSEHLPIWLGTPGGLKSVNVTGASQAVTVLSMGLGEPSNGITKLYAQLLAAKLNAARGASTTDITAALSAANNFLANNNQLNWTGLSKAQKNQVIGWMSTFDTFNNGLIGPGHCD